MPCWVQSGPEGRTMKDGWNERRALTSCKEKSKVAFILSPFSLSVGLTDVLCNPDLTH